MVNTFRVIDCDGDIEISIYKKANAIFKTNEYSKMEDICIYKETINIFNLLKENQELKKKYENAVADYETTMAEKEQLNRLVNSCQEEIRRLKKQLENKNKRIEYLSRSIERKEDTIIDLQNETIPYTNEYICKLETQRKEFIEYMNKTIEELECDDVDDEEMKGYLIQRIHIYKEILQKYKEIIGVSDEKK